MFVMVRYADLSLFEGQWEDAPSSEIQTISYIDPKGAAILRHRGDFYRLEDGEIVGHSYHAVVIAAYENGFRPIRHPETELYAWVKEHGYKAGSMVGSEKWQKVLALGMADRDSLVI